MEQKEQRNRSGFMLAQRAFLKLYMITLVEEEEEYGLEMLGQLKSRFQQFGYNPNHSEIYKSLHELIEAGIVYQIKRKREGSKRQEVVYYHFTEDGKEKAHLYKKQLKVELDRCHGLLRRAIDDNYKAVQTKTGS